METNNQFPHFICLFSENDATDSAISTPQRKRLCSNQNLYSSNDDDSLSRMCLSQPVPAMKYSVAASPSDDCDLAGVGDNRNAAYCFSQPAMIDDLLLSTQMNATQCANPFQRLVKRMTRFFVTTRFDETVRELTTTLDKLGFTWNLQPEDGSVVIKTKDRRKMDLIYRANLIEMDGKILLDFRLSRGCGLDFKRGFIKIKEQLADIIAKGPTIWPIAFATDTMPCGETLT